MPIKISTLVLLFWTDEGNQRVRQLTPVQIVKEGVANGATLAPGGIAPGEIVTIYVGPGVALGPAAGAGLTLDASGRVATQLAGVQVTFDGVNAPLTFVNDTQVNAIVPYAVAGKSTTQLQLTIQGKQTNTIILPVVASSPGVFAITNQDGTVNGAARPSPAGGVLVLFATGDGTNSPAVPDGTVNSSVFPRPNLPVSVKIGGQDSTVLYAGAAPGFVAARLIKLIGCIDPTVFPQLDDAITITLGLKRL